MLRNVFFLIAKLAALAAVSISNAAANTDNGFNVVPVLAFSCLFVLDLLISRLKHSKAAVAIFGLLGVIGCYVCGINEFFPVLLFIAYELIDAFAGNNYFYQISIMVTLLSFFICTPKNEIFAIFLSLLIFFVFSRILIERFEKARNALDEERKRSSEAKEKIARLEQYVKTVRETTAIEERSRFSARIHDKIGHSISSNIILLEGARLNVRTNPQKAEECIDIATESLRNGVDSIRAALKEERPDVYAIGEAGLDEALKSFSIKYGIKTSFKIEGDRKKISSNIWHCIKENLDETLTNMLKHSKGNKFTASIFIYSKVIRVEFSDNGACKESIKKGIGLEAIEERTLACGGKCLYKGGINGFTTINIFSI